MPVPARRLASILGVFAALWLGAAPAAAQIKQFGEYWTAACDNQRNCTAYGVHDMWQAGHIRIERAATADATPKITVAISQDRKARFTLAFDPPMAGILPQGPISPDRIDEDSYLRIPIEAPIETVVAALRKAKAVVYRPVEPIDRDADNHASRMVLTGAIAALAWIDQQQKRAGTMTALVARGTRSASAVPPPPDLPAVTAVRSTGETPAGYPPVVRERARTVCGKHEPNGEIRQSSRLDDRHVVYWFFCRGTSGAYNIHHALLMAPIDDPAAARTVMLRYPAHVVAIEKSRTGAAYNADFDPASGTLTTHYLERAAGDCGTKEQWVWNGRAFMLVLMQKMPVCGGIEPHDWPVLYRARLM